VNSEFSQEEAAYWAKFYMTELGRLPTQCRTLIKTVWIHKGDEVWGGGNDTIMIYTGKYTEYFLANGILLETFLHEAAHASLDASIA
jgi:hypothetical protein